MQTNSTEIITQAAQETGARSCRICGSSFELPPFVSPYVAQFATVCPACCENEAAEQAREQVRRMKAAPADGWKRICPEEFLATDPARLSCQRQLGKIMAWKFGPKGLLLHGISGKGKSRSAWLLLAREFKSGRSIAALDSGSGFEYAARFNEGAGEAMRWMDRLCRVEILLLDDIFKAKLTESFEAAIFSVIDYRTERQRPMIITTNDTGKTLQERMSPDRGPAMIRRFRDFCIPIHFS